MGIKLAGAWVPQGASHTIKLIFSTYIDVSNFLPLFPKWDKEILAACELVIATKNDFIHLTQE